MAVTQAPPAALPLCKRDVSDTDYELRGGWTALPGPSASFPKPGRPAVSSRSGASLDAALHMARSFDRKYYLNTEKDRVSPVRSYKSGFHFLSCIFSPCKPWEKM